MAKLVKSTLSALSKIGTSSSLKTSVMPHSLSLSSPRQMSFVASSPAFFNGQTSTSSRSQSSFRKPVQGCIFAAQKNQMLQYSTEVDKEISSFLGKEIEYEKSKTASGLPKIKGFDVETTEGNVTLTKTTGAEKIVIKLSVNGATEALVDDPNAPEDEPPTMVCRPNFDIELHKSDMTLGLQCGFPRDYEEEGVQDAQQGEPKSSDKIEDLFEIQEIAFLKGEWSNDTFSIPATTVDAELYDLLMDMLDERGVNDEFISQLVELCTAYEQTQYLAFLNKLKTFSEK